MEIVKLIDKGNSKNRYAYLNDGSIIDCMLDPVYKIENAYQLKELINLNSTISTQNWLSIVLLYRINGKREPKWHNVSNDIEIDGYYDITNRDKFKNNTDYKISVVASDCYTS